MFIRKSMEESNVLLHRVAKHGSHDQKTHGRKGGGGSGGGGGSSDSSSLNSEMADKERTTVSRMLADDLNETERSLDDLSTRVETNADRAAVDRASKNISDAKKDFKQAAQMKGRAQTEQMQRGIGRISAAQNQLSMVDDERADDIAQSLLDNLSDSLGDGDSIFRDLGLDVDDLLGP